MVLFEGLIIFVENELEPLNEVFFALSTNTAAYTILLDSGYLSKRGIEFSFQFVGVISLPEICICVLPKYYKNHDFTARELLGECLKVVKVLKKAGAIESSLPDYHHISTNENINFSELLLADKLIRDYLEHGIFTKSVEIGVFGESGEIDWSKTIETVNPIFSKKSSVYIEYFSSATKYQDYNIIAELHKFIIKKCLRKFGSILGYEFSFVEDTVINLADLGNHSQLMTILTREMDTLYLDTELRLIKRMISYLEGIQDSSQGKFEIFGTGFFHVIWEKACGVLFNNKLEYFKKHLPKAVWSDLQGNQVTKDSLRPDIICETQNGVHTILLDAKYYNLRYGLEPFTVESNPGISDVTKQFLYQKLFEEVLQKEIGNYFLFPKIQASIFDVVGYVIIPLFPGKKIYNMFISADKVLSSYLSEQQLGDDVIERIVDNQF